MLPSDRYLADILGLTEEQYRHFQIEVRKRAAEGPQPAAVAETALVLAIVNIVLAVGSLALSALLKPAVPKLGQAPGSPRQRQESPDPVIRNSQFAPRYGFDSQQEIATLGSVIPIVYSNRELIDGDYYGGIRINMPMLWNQILSLGGGQMLRGVFLLGEGSFSGLDATGFAIGSSTLRGYLFESSSATEEGARVTVYFSADGGRITGTDRIAGRTEANDIGSSGSTDVFQVYWNGQQRTDFCASNRPSTQTTFGVYSLIGNDFMYKVNPVIRPGVRSQTGPGSGTQITVDCPVDAPQMNARDKYRAHFSTFSGVYQINETEGSNTEVAVTTGNQIRYQLYEASDWTTVFTTYGGTDDDAEAKDVSSSVAALQKSWDDRLVVGELYKIGTAVCVCTSRSPSSEFVSQADLDGATGQSIEVTFSVVEPGSVKSFAASRLTDPGGDLGLREKATTGGHLLRYARGTVSTSRACQAVEFGLRSTLGIRISNLCNFRDTKTYQYADTQWCQTYENNPPEDIINNFYQSSTITSPVQRYSFFKIKHREIDSANWTTLTHAYGARSETQQAVFNYIRLEFSDLKQREFMFEPLSGFEIRNSRYGAGAVLYVLDPKKGRLTVSENGATAVFNGEAVSLSESTFGINYGRANPALESAYVYDEDTNGSNPTITRNYNGLPKVDVNTYIDDYGKLAEAFVYSEVSSSADSGPEHEIVYVNEIVPNTSTPLYDDLSLVGINIMSSAEFQQFAQFSSYVTGGKQCNLLLGGTGATHLFPDALYDLMTNERYGAGSFIKPYMINTAEFAAAAQWCQSRRYFYDAAVAEPINIRQWAADLAATHLLQFGETDGKFFLRPAISFSAVAISALFTAGNILEDSFKLEYFDPEDRDPIQVSVNYREERPSNDLTSPGLFPVVREVLVREINGSETDPIEQLDMSGYCTSRTHAVDAAKFLVRMRRIPTHVIEFQTMHDGLTASLAPGDYIKVAMEETEYDEFNNGVVTPEGALVSTTKLADGSYSVIAWDGTEGTPPSDLTLVVKGNTATPAGIVFTVKSTDTQVRVYQVERITPSEDGGFTINAMHMPVNDLGILQVADGFDNDTNWVIEG